MSQWMNRMWWLLSVHAGDTESNQANSPSLQNVTLLNVMREWLFVTWHSVAWLSQRPECRMHIYEWGMPGIYPYHLTREWEFPKMIMECRNVNARNAWLLTECRDSSIGLWDARYRPRPPYWSDHTGYLKRSCLHAYSAEMDILRWPCLT